MVDTVGGLFLAWHRSCWQALLSLHHSVIIPCSQYLFKWAARHGAWLSWAPSCIHTRNKSSLCRLPLIMSVGALLMITTSWRSWRKRVLKLAHHRRRRQQRRRHWGHWYAWYWSSKPAGHEYWGLRFWILSCRQVRGLNIGCSLYYFWS